MSGAGSFGAGSAPAGSYTPSASSATAATMPRALKLDPAARDFLLDDDGRYIAVHPVEHAAMMALVPALDSIRSAQGQGGAWRGLEIDDAATMTTRFGEMVRAAWRDLAARGDLRIESVTARPTNAWGRGRFEIVWTNLRDPQNPNRTTTL